MMQLDRREYPNTRKNKGAPLSLQMTTYLGVLGINVLFFFQIAKGMSSIGMKKIFNHIICFDSTLLGPEKKAQSSVYLLFLH